MSIHAEPVPSVPRAAEVLTPEALAFVEELHTRFAGERNARIEARHAKREQVRQTGELDFLPETESVRTGEWQVAAAPPALLDRRVEITGPAAPAKMAINALNSGANIWLADLEDASSPTWHNVVESQLNLADAARGTLEWTSPEGKEYRLRTDAPLAVMVVRPRGWHLDELNVTIDGKPAIGALVDFGLHFFHNAKVLHDTGRGPFYYLPKTESHLEARLWNDIFAFAEERVGIPHGTVRATVLIETIPAAFEMEEILYELREHASGLNAGRWDYLFSIVKTFRDQGARFILPDRASVTMTAPFMRAYTDLLVSTCHKRGAFAIGGMAAAIPNRKEPEVTKIALEKVRADKNREAGDGFDGSWVAHPDLVSICKEEFDAVLGSRPNQVDRKRDDVHVTPDQLLDIAAAGGGVTEAGLRSNLYVAISYVGSWLSGTGAAAIRNLMEDVATAEISRSQIWQQVRNGVRYTDTGDLATPELVERLLAEETERLRGEVGEAAFEAYYGPASTIVRDLALEENFDEFLTLPAYDRLEQSASSNPAV